MDPTKLRAWWFDRQGLMNPDPSASAAEVLARTGWARSVGGATPYLTLAARAGVSREQADRDLESQKIHELPCARGCTYIVPRAHYALALTVGQGTSDEAPIAMGKKLLGVTEAEIERLMCGVENALADGPLDPRELKAALGELVRNLGAEGKKRGSSTTLPMALGRLQSHGRIRRVPISGRLDQQRYRYALWRPSPLDGAALSREEAFVELARLYFGWIGPASVAQFQWFSGLGVKAAKTAVAALDLVPLEAGSELLLFPKDLDTFQAYQTPDEPRYALVGGIDGLTHFRRDLTYLIDAEDAGRHVMGDRDLVVVSGLLDMASHGIFDRGRLVGLWEYDPVENRITWLSFVPREPSLQAAVAATEAFVRDQLGDARSFSLDSPESRKPRLELLAANE